MSFEEDGRTVLLGAGWSPDRRVPVDPYIAELSKDGYARYEAVEEFLASFGGITVGEPGCRRVRRSVD